MSDDLRSLFDKARFRSEERGFLFGLVGKHNVDTSVSYQVAGRQDFLYVTIASKTVIIARNDAGVPQTENYPVKLRRDSLGIYIIVARATNSTLGAPIAIPPSGVVAHSTSHKHGGSDEVATATPGANAIVKAAATGLIANGWLDATLASIAALGTVADRIAYTTALDTWAETPLTAFARTLLDDANQAAVQATLALVPGTNVQAYDATLLSIAALGTAADKMLYTTGIDTWAEAAITSYGRTLVALASATALRANINVADGADVTGTAITALATKTTPVDADAVVITDSAASDAPKRTLWSNIKATLKTYFDTLYFVLAGKAGGQSGYGGTGAGDGLAFDGTSNATKGPINLNQSGGNTYIGGFAQIGNADGLGAAVASTTVYAAQYGDLGQISYWPSVFFNAYYDAAGVDAIRYVRSSEPAFYLQLDYGSNNLVLASAAAGTAGDAITFATKMVVTQPGVMILGGLTSAGASVLGVKAGTSTNDAAVGGILYTKATSTGNVGAGLDVLATYTIPANTLSANGMSIRFVAQGRFAGAGSNKTITVDFGAAGTKQLFTSTTFQTTETWLLEGEVMRTGAATQVGWCRRTENGAIYYQSSIALNQTLSSAVVFTIYGESTAAITDEVILDSLKIFWDDQNT